MRHKNLVPVVTIVLFFIVGFLLYLPASGGGWYMDDCHIFTHSSRDISFQGMISQIRFSRGLAYFSFSLDQLFWGINPLYSRWVNVLLHVVNSLLVVVLFRQITGARWGALFTGFLFLCHPVQTSAVSYIVQRMTILSALFALLAVILADRYLLMLKNREEPSLSHMAFLFLSVMCGLLSCMAKENTILLPVVVLALAWYRGGNRLGEGWKRIVLATSVIPVVTIGLRLLSSGSMGTALDSNFTPVGDNGGPFYDFIRDESWLPFRYFLSQMEVFWVYIKLVIMPYRQMLDYSWPMPDVMPKPLHVATFMLILLVLMMVYKLRNRFPLTFLGAIWVVFFMAMESSFLPLDPIFEHRLYLPLFGFVLISHEQFFARLHRMGPVFITLILIGFSYSTVLRNAEWGDPVKFWKNNVKYASRAGRPRFSLTEQLFFAGKYQEATNALEPLIHLIPDAKVEELHLRAAETKFFAGNREAALEIFRKAGEEDETRNISELYRAYLAIESGQYGNASELLDKADAKEAKTVFSNYLRGWLAEKQDDYIKAIEYYQGAIDNVISGKVFSTKLTFERTFADWSRKKRILLIHKISPWLDRQRGMVRADPGNAVTRGNWANQLLVLGLYDEAITEYELLKKYAPDSWRLHYNLGIAYSRIGKNGLAAECFTKTLALSPGNTNAMLNYGLLLYEGNNLSEAKNVLESTLKSAPYGAGRDGKLWITYGNVLRDLKEKRAALAAYKRARNIPGYGGAAKRLIEDLN